MTLPAALLTEAAQATPPQGQSGRWAPLMPAVEILLGRGFSLADAMDWLVARSAVQPHERRTAYYSVSQRLRRAGLAATCRKVDG